MFVSSFVRNLRFSGISVKCGNIFVIFWHNFGDTSDSHSLDNDEIIGVILNYWFTCVLLQWLWLLISSLLDRWSIVGSPWKLHLTFITKPLKLTLPLNHGPLLVKRWYTRINSRCTAITLKSQKQFDSLNCIWPILYLNIF